MFKWWLYLSLLGDINIALISSCLKALSVKSASASLTLPLTECIYRFVKDEFRIGETKISYGKALTPKALLPRYNISPHWGFHWWYSKCAQLAFEEKLESNHRDSFLIFGFQFLVLYSYPLTLYNIFQSDVTPFFRCKI